MKTTRRIGKQYLSSKDIGAPMSSVVLPHKDTLDEWLDDWMNGHDLWAEVWG